MKKILYITEAMGGGVLTYLVNLCNSLSSNFDIYIAYGIRKQTPKDLKKLFKKNIHLILVPDFTREISPLHDLKAFFEIKRIVKEINPDIVHLNSSKAGVLGRLGIRNKKISLFYTPHGYSFLMKDRSLLSRKIYRIIEKLCAKYSNCTTISVSKGEDLQTRTLTSNCTYINTGINIAEIDNLFTNKDNTLNSKIVVFTLGRITYPKNPQLFNELAKKLPNIKFVWIGDGELRNCLTSPNIVITGWMDRLKAIKQISNYDIFVLPSIWEGLPLSLLESMYLKKLCLVSKFVGSLGVIQNKENGYVCKSVEEYKKAIINFSNPANKRLIEKAHMDVIQKFSIKVMSNKYKKLYLESLVN